MARNKTITKKYSEAIFRGISDITYELKPLKRKFVKAINKHLDMVEQFHAEGRPKNLALSMHRASMEGITADSSPRCRPTTIPFDGPNDASNAVPKGDTSTSMAETTPEQIPTTPNNNNPISQHVDMPTHIEVPAVTRYAGHTPPATTLEIENEKTPPLPPAPAPNRRPPPSKPKTVVVMTALPAGAGYFKSTHISPNRHTDPPATRSYDDDTAA